MPKPSRKSDPTLCCPKCLQHWCSGATPRERGGFPEAAPQQEGMAGLCVPATGDPVRAAGGHNQEIHASALSVQTVFY